MIHLDAARVALVAAAALLAGAVNAVAGGGTLLSFPALLLLGFPALTANVTSTLGLLPGYAGGSIAYRVELSAQREWVRFLTPISVVGAPGGAVLLTRTSPALFAPVVPWLILLACALLLLQPVVSAAGGFGGVALARRLHPTVLRTLVVARGVAFSLHLLL